MVFTLREQTLFWFSGDGGSEFRQWFLSQVKGAIDDDVTEGKKNTCYKSAFYFIIVEVFAAGGYNIHLQSGNLICHFLFFKVMDTQNFRG
uniref:Uncharacterized protein n=1 Tax=Astyanax mexicanus TaxID=7994 RepID=A0A8B9L6Q6_ASTMX